MSSLPPRDMSCRNRKQTSVHASILLPHVHTNKTQQKKTKKAWKKGKKGVGKKKKKKVGAKRGFLPPPMTMKTCFTPELTIQLLTKKVNPKVNVSLKKLI